MHIHIHLLIHYARHARLLGGNMRALGTMLLMLLFSLLQLVSAKPASAALTAEENRPYTIGFRNEGAVSMSAESDLTPGLRYRGADRTAPTDAMNTSSCTSVFYRLKPRIVMVPRMNRVPRPKSVYRSFARAPGADLLF